MRILISAGEVSGDRVGACIAHQLRRHCPSCELYGLGGDRMEHAGVKLLAHTTQLSAVGLTEGVAVGPRLFRCWRRVRDSVRRQPPDVALLIGNDVFHVLMARRLRSFGIPVAAFLPPQVWVWRSFAGAVARSFDLILASFPDEDQVYRDAGGRVTFVGHYLSNDLAPVTATERRSARELLELPAAGPVIGLLPGSRPQEIKRMGPAFLDAAALMAHDDVAIRFVMPVADRRLQPALVRELRTRRLDDLVRLTDDSRTAMRAADVLLITSGTATLEAMLLRVPMVIAYRVSALSHAAIRGCIRLGLIADYIVGIPNILLGRVAVPELLQRQLTGSALASTALAILRSSDQQKALQAAYDEAAARLPGGDTLSQVARTVVAVGRRNEIGERLAPPRTAGQTAHG